MCLGSVTAPGTAMNVLAVAEAAATVATPPVVTAGAIAGAIGAA